MSKLLIFLLLLGIQVNAQDTPLLETSVDTASAALSVITPKNAYPEPLLPHHLPFTQRIFWGPNGLLRVVHLAPLTAEGRQKEVKIRRFMLITHEVTGYAALAGFLVQGILGAKASRATGAEYNRLARAQQMLVTVTNITYGTTALLALTAPPKLLTARKSRSGIQLHKYLSIVHLTGFIATNVLAGKVAQHTELRPYRQVAAFTTFAAFAPALIALKF